MTELGRKFCSSSSLCEFLTFCPVLELVVSKSMASLGTPSSAALREKVRASGWSQVSVKFPLPPLKRILGARPAWNTSTALSATLSSVKATRLFWL